jgi:hypothetical protein
MPLKRGQLRRRAAYSEADLLAVARKLYNASDLQFRVPGQRDGALAIMAPQPAELVVLVIGTGSGKTLVVMIGAAVADVKTTILILPMVYIFPKGLVRSGPGSGHQCSVPDPLAVRCFACHCQRHHSKTDYRKS